MKKTEKDCGGISVVPKGMKPIVKRDEKKTPAKPKKG